MKFSSKTLLLSFLIASSLVINVNGQVAEIVAMVVPTVKVVKDALDFCKKIFDVSAQNANRYTELSKTLSEVADLSQTQVTQYASEITVALKSASDRYDSMILDMRTMCIFNIESKDSYYMFVNADLDHGDLDKEIKRRFRFLTAMVEKTINETTQAKAEINLVHKEITGVSGKLVHIQETFNTLAKQKSAEMQSQIQDEDIKIKNAHWRFLFFHGKNSAVVNQAESNKESLQKKINLLNKFVEDTQAYVNWLESSGNALKKAAQERGIDVADMMGTAQQKKQIIQFLKRMREEEEDPNEVKDYIFSSLNAAVNNISALSYNFIQKTSRANTIMTRNKRSPINRSRQIDSKTVAPIEEARNELSYKVIEKKVNVVVAFPVEKILQTYKSMNASFPYLGERTIKKASYLSVFINSGLDVLENLRTTYETSNRDYIREIGRVAAMRNATVNTPELHANVAQLSAYWRDAVLELRRLGAEWTAYRDNQEREYKTMPAPAKRMMNLQENKEPVKQYLDEKIYEVVDRLKGLENTTLKQVSNFAGHLNAVAGVGLNGPYDSSVYFGLEGSESGMPTEKIAKNTVNYFMSLLQG